MKLIFVIPILFSTFGSSLAPLSNFQVVKNSVGSDVDTDQLKQFDVNDYELIGESTSSVCSNDITLNGFSCISGDLEGLDVNKYIYGLGLSEDKLITITDDYQSESIYLYVFRNNVKHDYSKVSLSIRYNDYYNYDFVNELDEYNLTSFYDYDLRLISMSSNYKFVKYQLIGDLVNKTATFWNNQRDYVVRELIISDNEILPVAIQYSCNNDNYVVQNELKYFTAEQYIFDNWFRLGTNFTTTDYVLAFFGGIWGMIPLNKYRENDHKVVQQTMMLFNLRDDQQKFLESNLRAIKFNYSSYQMVGYASGIIASVNDNQGVEFINKMPLNWKSSENNFISEYTFENAFVGRHVHPKKKVNSKIRQVGIRQATDKYSLDVNGSFLSFRKYTYNWNGLGTTADFLSNTSSFIKKDYTSLLNSYNYYTVLDTTVMDITYHLWGEPFGFGTDDYEIDTKNLPDENGKYALPTYYYDVSITEFWYEENGEIHKGIVMSNYESTNGAVNLFNFEPENTSLQMIIYIIMALLAFFVLSIFLNLVGILKPIFMLFVFVIKYVFKGVFWVVKLPYTIIKAIVNRGQG